MKRPYILRIEAIGPHHTGHLTGDPSTDADHLVRDFIATLTAHGHTVTRSTIFEDPEISAASPEKPVEVTDGLRVNTLLREVHEGVLTLLERTAPKGAKQPAQKAAEKKEGGATAVAPGNDPAASTPSETTPKQPPAAEG